MHTIGSPEKEEEHEQDKEKEPHYLVDVVPGQVPCHPWAPPSPETAVYLNNDEEIKEEERGD